MGKGKNVVYVSGPTSLCTCLVVPGQLAVGDGNFTCCTRFDDHTITSPTGEKIKIPCDKKKIGLVLVPLLESYIDLLKEDGKLQSYRFALASWKKDCRSLDTNLTSSSHLLSHLPSTWEGFCKQFMLPNDKGMHFTNKLLKKLECLPPLFYAVMSGNITIVKMILESSANPNFAVGFNVLIDSMNYKGATALTMAAMCCHSDPTIFKLLVDAGADAYQRTKFMTCPIGYALSQRNHLFLDWLEKRNLTK